MDYDMLRSFVKTLPDVKLRQANGIAGMRCFNEFVQEHHFDIFDDEEKVFVRAYAEGVRKTFLSYPVEQRQMMQGMIELERGLPDGSA